MAAPERPTPNGSVKELALNDIFFSVTDVKGVIEMSNSVFERLSGYSHDELVGAPHNIIRHPVMPGGAFKLVWDELLAGKAAVAYVHNLAKDGEKYTVCSTLTPVGDKLLSVRVAPCCPELLAVADTLYGRASEAEEAAKAEGASRADAAVTGAESLNADLAGAGYETFEDYLKDLLPYEVAARVKRGDVPPHRPEATGVLAQILNAARGVYAETVPLVEALDELSHLTTDLLEPTRASAPLIAELERRAARAVAAGEAHREELPFLAEVAGNMAGRVQAAHESQDTLTNRMTRAAHAARDLRFRIALLRLHNNMVAFFAAELLDGHTVPQAREAMEILCRAVREESAGTRETVDSTLADLQEVSGAVASISKSLSGYRRQRGKWEAELPENLSEDLTSVREELSAGDEVEELLTKLTAVGARSGNMYINVDDGMLDKYVAEMEAAIKQVEA